MEVSTVQDKITHAVVGGQKMVDFQISDDAEFYHLLSNALYSKKEMAVVREVLCNAWDAHIDSGNTHLPVKVTIEDGMMIIRDYGKGISKDNIGPVYCVYGGSDKKKNGNVTGGFGLGAKAPFAITEHFEVTSFHEEEKTIYRMSLSHAVAGGKPSCIPIMTLPTEESGLEVKIKLPDEEYDEHEFKQLVKFVTYYGQMKVEMNGDILRTMTEPKKGNNFIIMPHGTIDSSKVNRSRLYLRYGNVIYPVEDNKIFQTKYEELKKFLSYSKSAYYSSIDYAVILFAEPNSIAVTPSRESLSMTERTSNTILQLITNFMNSCSVKEDAFNNKLLEEHYNNGFNTFLPKDVLCLDITAKSYISKKLKLNDNKEITTFEDFFIEKYINSHLHFNSKYERKDATLRAKALLGFGIGRKNTIHKYLELLRVGGSFHYDFADEFVKLFLKPLVKKGVGIVNKKDFYIYTGSSYGDPKLTDFVNYNFTMAKSFQFLSNIIVLSPKKTGLKEQLMVRPELYKWYGYKNDMIAYYMPKSDSARQKVRDYFASLDVKVIDLTVRTKWDAPPVKRERKPKPEVPVVKAVGFPKLSHIKGVGYTFNSNYVPADNTERITNPEYVAVLPYTKHGNARPNGFQNRKFIDFMEVYGEKGAYVRTYKTVFANPDLKDLPSIEDYLGDKIKNCLTQNPDVLEYVSIYKHIGSLTSEYLIKALFSCKDIRDKYSIRTEWDSETVYLGEYLLDFSYHQRTYEYPSTYKELQKVTIHTGLNDLIEAVQDSKLIQLLDPHEIKKALESPDPKTKADANSLLHLLLES